jgi:hypothetical protein
METTPQARIGTPGDGPEASGHAGRRGPLAPPPPSAPRREPSHHLVWEGGASGQGGPSHPRLQGVVRASAAGHAPLACPGVGEPGRAEQRPMGLRRTHVCSAPSTASHLGEFLSPPLHRAPVTEPLMRTLGVVPGRDLVLACVKSRKTCCQTHSSFRLRKKRWTYSCVTAVPDRGGSGRED